MKRARPFVAYRKVYSWPIKYIVLLFICALFGLCTIYIYFFYTQYVEDDVTTLDEQKHELKIRREPIFTGKKYVHLDLKGAPPKLSYYEYLFPLLASVGANGIVIEYEDMFPFEGVLRNISALNSYTRDEIKLIHHLAQKNSLEIIPLVQTFGHLEFILKLEEFKDIREVPELPQTLCPSLRKSMEVVTDMLSQIIESHPESKMIHIGADETYQLGMCKQCKERLKYQNISKEALYLKHIGNVCKFIEKKYPHISILLWDDQLRYIYEDEMEDSVTTFNVTPVVWQYSSNVFDKLGPTLWEQYSKFFKNVWIASAFKGATEVDQLIVDIPHYTQNHHSWISIIENYRYLVNFEAIILTGWQRYDHFSILCELLPVAIPSLIMNLKILSFKENNRFGLPKEVAEILKCKQPYALLGTSFGSPRCSYTGSEILENVYRLNQLKEDFEKLKKLSQVRGWMSESNSYYRFSSPYRIRQVSSQIDHFKREIDEIEESVSEALLEVYDVYTKDEWIFTYVKPLQKQIKDISRFKDEIFATNVWPRRPFNIVQPN